MRLAAQLALFFICAPNAAGQAPPAAPAELSAIKISDQPASEVRIELSTTSSVASPEIVETYRDSLVLELPGAIYRALPRRIRVDRAGIRAVRVWMQSEHPASTRIVVEIDRTEQYALTSDRNTVVLRVGPVLEGLSPADIHSTAEVFGRRTPAAAARGAASASVVGALSGIFHSRSSKPTIYKGPSLGDPKQPVAVPSRPNDRGIETTNSGSSSSSSPTLPPSVSAQVHDSSSQNVEPAGAENPVSAALPQAPSATEPVASQSEPTITNPPSAVGPVSPLTALASATSESGSSSAEALNPPSAPNALQGDVSPEAKPDASQEPAEASASEAPPSPHDARAVIAVTNVANPGIRTEFHVKFVEEESAYIDGGRSSGLTEGMKLLVKAAASDAASQPSNADRAVAELVVTGVAETSAVTEIHAPQREVVPGDVAYLSSESIETLVQQHAMGASRSYPAVISFSEGGDALDEEAHAFVPRPPLPSVNHAVARIGFDYTATKSTDASQINSSSFGGIVRVDFTRMGGTYWDLRGYWRGRFVSTSAASQQTLQDLLNRTYHLALTYENPQSPFVVGVGRMYLPWAVSLETIDGGYIGGRLGHGTTLGIFGGSTPDPTSWNYNPDRHLGGAFFNAEGGSFDSFHYSSTVGLGEDFENVQYSTTTSTGTSTSTYPNNRPFAFIENSFTRKRTFSIFQAMQADRPSANPAVASPGAGISRSFTTLRIQPISRVELTANHTYFRDIPTFDPQLIGTGLLDKYLFQGLSGGVRIEPIKKIFLYTDLGRSSRTGDAKTSLNQLYGITFGELPKVKLRADVHYSKFTSSFGAGTYRAFSLSRSIGDRLHFEAIGGDQVFASSLAGNQNAKFFTTNLDTSLGAVFFLQGGFTMYRGQQNYDQSYVTLGYRFDSKRKRK
jgi:AMIN domain